MRKSPLLLLLICACATGPSVTLDFYRGVYATHFDGIPDQAEICAVVTNRTDRPVSWARLRLRAYPTYGEREGRWTSGWVYRGRLDPGERKAVRLVVPPVADQIELELRGAGRGEGPLSNRTAVEAEECTEAFLQRQLIEAREGRTAPGMALYPIVRRNDPSPEIVVARER